MDELTVESEKWVGMDQSHNTRHHPTFPHDTTQIELSNLNQVPSISKAGLMCKIFHLRKLSLVGMFVLLLISKSVLFPQLLDLAFSQAKAILQRSNSYSQVGLCRCYQRRSRKCPQKVAVRSIGRKCTYFEQNFTKGFANIFSWLPQTQKDINKIQASFHFHPFSQWKGGVHVTSYRDLESHHETVKYSL